MKLGIKFTNILPTHVKTHNTIWLGTMNYFISDTGMSNSTITVAHFGEKGGNLQLRLWARSHTIYAAHFCPNTHIHDCSFS